MKIILYIHLTNEPYSKMQKYDFSKPVSLPDSFFSGTNG